MIRPPSNESIRTLYSMLQTMRPHGSNAERDFTKRFLLPLGMQVDAFGNLSKRIGDAPVVWSSHVDTVHRSGGTQNIVQDDKYMIRLNRASKSNCLGADDTAGVWLMTEMIHARIPGLYIFHRGEECGGKGSTFIAKHNAALVKGMRFIIAFDRKDVDSVITHQWGGRCCSDEFGKSLGEQLSYTDNDFKLDRGGSFTDSANYIGLIGECTNVSVGYKWQHSFTEELSLPHLVQLRTALLGMDLTKLVEKRKAGEKEPVQTYRYNSSYYDGADRSGGYTSDYAFGNWFGGGYYEDGKWHKCTKGEWEAWKEKKKKATALALVKTPEEELRRYVWSNSNDVAEMLFDWGFDADDIKACILESRIRAATSKPDPVTVVNNPMDKIGTGPIVPKINGATAPKKDEGGDKVMI